MGLPFTDLVRPGEIAWSELAGRRLAIDGNNAVYQFLATIRQRDGMPFTDASGHVTSHLIGILNRNLSLLAEGVQTAWVFDGRAPELKAGTLRARFRAKAKAEAEWKEALAREDYETARKKAAATSRFTPEMAAEAVELLHALGLPTVQAPAEGEAQAAVMAQGGAVWATGSQDYDTLLFGAPRLVRGLAARSAGGDQPAAQLIDREAWLAELGISAEELILVGLLVGTDFNDGAKGYGPKRSLKLAQRHLGWEATLREAGLDPAEVEAAAEIFRHPEVTSPGPLAFGPVNEEAVERLLVDGHGFSADRLRSTLAKARRPRPAPAPRPDGRRQARLEGFGP